ncbi:MAG: hypothetical protein AAB907_00470 [Patescibacteria group bacterium]
MEAGDLHPTTPRREEADEEGEEASAQGVLQAILDHRVLDSGREGEDSQSDDDDQEDDPRGNPFTHVDGPPAGEEEGEEISEPEIEQTIANGEIEDKHEASILPEPPILESGGEICIVKSERKVVDDLKSRGASREDSEDKAGDP